MAMSLYANTFRWLLVKINARIVGKDAFATVGLLDIFGFENFEVRRAVCVCDEYYNTSLSLKGESF